MRVGAISLVLGAMACAGPARAPGPAPRPSASGASVPSASAADAWRAAVPKPGAPGQIDYPAPAAAKLQSGLTLYVVQRPAKIATLTVVVRHGASSVPRGKSGLAALTSRMLTEGTRHRGPNALAEAAESLGSSLEHDAGRDYSSVSLTTLVADVPLGLELLAEVVREPAFAPKELERVRAEWIDGLKSERQAPERLASLAGLRLLLGEPAGAPVGGSISDVKALGAKDLSSFHRDFWVPSESAIVVVGDVEPGAIRRAVDKSFGAWRGQPARTPNLPAPAPAPPRHLVLVDRPDSVQSALFVAQRFPERSEPGFESRQVLNGIVGGLFTSRINKNLREEHAYTYGARSDAIATRAWGAFVVATSVETGVTADALVELEKELLRAKDPSRGAPIGAEEVARARADLASGLGAHLEETDRVASDFALGFAAGLGPGYYADYPQALGRLSVAEIDKEAQRIDPEHLVIVVVGDKSTIQPALEAHGMHVELATSDLTD